MYHSLEVASSEAAAPAAASALSEVGGPEHFVQTQPGNRFVSVSYTHLTLPTILRV